VAVSSAARNAGAEEEPRNHVRSEMKDPLIDRAREAFAAYRGPGREIIDELVFALIVANNEVERVREMNAALLAASKDLLDTVPPPPTDIGRHVFDGLRDAIWKATP
jgi:hypothetical protein